jgi:acetolactate synthase-1/2/3 large subunit
MRLADYVFSYLADLGLKNVFFLPGGGAMHLNNALYKETRISAISMLHEQGASIAAEGYARSSGQFGVCLVTSGPGATNAITGVTGAWFESTPMLIISGQVKRADLKGSSGLRQLGTQELDIVEIVKSITKYATCIQDPNAIKYELEKALFLMCNGRKGPVWIDIPLDVQASEISFNNLIGYAPDEPPCISVYDDAITEVINSLKISKRPVLIVGNGIHSSNAERELINLIESINLPTLTTWIAADLIEDCHPMSYGRPGTVAPRGANFIVQNSDLVISIGARMDFSITGFDRTQFARNAKKIIIDIDQSEIDKLGSLPDFSICIDAKLFLRLLLEKLSPNNITTSKEWIAQCTKWKHSYPVILNEYRSKGRYINSYVFAETLCDVISQNDLIVPGSSGAAIDTFWLAAKLKKGQRSIPTGGLGSMGYGLPSAIGACIARNKCLTIAIDGDGGFVMNIQELEIVKRLQLPIKFFILNNNGYASIRSSQSGYFNETIGCDPSSGLTLPSIEKIARAFEINYLKLEDQNELYPSVKNAYNQAGPVICEVFINPDQPIGPRVSSKINPDGSMTSSPLEDLYPFLPREELQSNMLTCQINGGQY